MRHLHDRWPAEAEPATPAPARGTPHRRLRHTAAARRPPIEVNNEALVHAPAEAIWDLLADVASWPTWYEACRWVQVDSTTGGRSFRWKAHPVTLRSTVVAAERPHLFAITADARGLHADRSFTIYPTSRGTDSIIRSHETQTGPLPTVGRTYISPRLHAANDAMFADLARVAERANNRTPIPTSTRRRRDG